LGKKSKIMPVCRDPLGSEALACESALDVGPVVAKALELVEQPPELPLT